MISAELLRRNAIEATALFYINVIRNEIGDDPDHSGPEDVSAALAGMVIEKGYEVLLNRDYRELPT
jgi:hypothetical protein